MKVNSYWTLPWNLKDVIDRVNNGGIVWGFELELLADYIS